MNRFGFVTGLICAWLIGHAGLSAACEATVSCESVEVIHVSEGRRHLAGGLVETIYGASVMIDVSTSNLKEVRANCPHQTIVIRIGTTVFELPPNAVSTGGNCFWVDYSTPKEVLDAAMKMCPDKVKSYLQ